MELILVTGVCHEIEVRHPAILKVPWSLRSQVEALKGDLDMVSFTDLDNPFLGNGFMAEVLSNLTLFTS